MRIFCPLSRLEGKLRHKIEKKKLKHERKMEKVKRRAEKLNRRLEASIEQPSKREKLDLLNTEGAVTYDFYKYVGIYTWVGIKNYRSTYFIVTCSVGKI